MSTAGDERLYWEGPPIECACEAVYYQRCLVGFASPRDGICVMHDVKRVVESLEQSRAARRR